MAIGDVSVRVVPDATDFWRSFRARTAGQATAEGRRAGADFRRGMEEGTARPIKIRADVDTTRARAELAALNREGNQSGGGLLKALLPLAPALAPLAGAAIAAGSGLAVLGGAGVLALTGLKREMRDATDTGRRAAAAVGTVKDELHALQATASRAALPGLEASVVAIRRELPALREVVGEQATIAGQVIAHLTRGIVGGFTTFRPIIDAVGKDVDTLAAHFEAFSTGPGGARFAKTLATDYAQVKPVIESVTRAVVDIARAGSQGGLGILHILGEVANLIDSFPTPVLTAIVDGFLAFRAVGAASSAINSVSRAFASVRTQAQTTSAVIRLSSLQATAAREQEAAAAAVTAQTNAENDLREAEAARASALQIIQAREGVQAVYSAQAEALLASADAEIAAYRAVAQAAAATATEQVAAARASTAAAATAGKRAGGASVAGTLGKALLPIALVATALPLLSSAFGDNSEKAQQAAAAVDSYTSALVNSKGAIDDTVRATAAKNLADANVFNTLRRTGLTANEITDAVTRGGAAMDAATGKVNAYAKSVGLADVLGKPWTQLLRDQRAEFVKGAGQADTLRAATDSVTEAQRRGARALHANVGDYLAAADAAAKSIDKTREQTIAFQLENDAASLLSQALKSLAGQNLDVATAQTSFEQSTNAAIAALKKGKDAISGHSDAALADQQAIQGSVSAARQYADAVAKQTGSSAKAAAAYRASRNELLSQLRAQGLLTPALQRYINKLFDVKGVSDYLRKHPTKLDADSAAAKAKISALQAQINAIRQYQATHVDADTIAAQNALSRLQGEIDALHGKTVVISTITPDGSSVNVGNTGRGFGLATGGPVHGPGTGTSDSIPAWLSNGEYVVNAKATAKHRHLLDAINRGVRGFAAGGAVSSRAVQSTNQLVPDVHSLVGSLSGAVSAVRLAMNAFIKDFAAAGASARQIARANRDESMLLANQQRLVNARARLDKITQYGDTVRGALTGGFDPTKFGSVSDLITGYQSQTGQNNAYTKEVNALRKRAGKNQAELSLINTLAASGQSASLESLAAGSVADLANATKAYSGYNASVQGGVDAASIAKYGATRGQASKDVDRLVENSDRLLSAMASLGAVVAHSHGKSGAQVERQLEAMAQQLEALVRHGRRTHP